MPFSGPIEDRLAIRELMDIYADAVNQRDTALWASTWAEDSAWKLPVIPGMENLRGKDTIVSSWEAGMAMFPFIFMSISVGDIQVILQLRAPIPQRWAPPLRVRRSAPGASTTINW